MDRRALLKIAGAVLLAGLPQRPVRAEGLRVVVAGAGIVGASIAWHLVRAGARVTVIDKLGPATHASRGTFAWINATWAKQPRHYHRLNQAGVSNWNSLADELSIPVRWGGSLEWFAGEERQAKLEEQIAEQSRWNEPARMLHPGELAELEPAIEFGAVESVAYSPNDGAVDPVLATNRLIEDARDFGATVRYPCELTDIEIAGDGLAAVVTSCGTIEADRLVLATGAAPGAASRFAGIDIPQRSTPGIIAITEPVDPLLTRVIAAPGIHMHQRDDGRIVVGEQDGAPETHDTRLDGMPNDFPDSAIAGEHAERMLEIAAEYLPGIAGAAIESVYIGWRPLPLDGHPVIGASPERPDVYLAIMHSGVTLAPIAGQLAASEILSGETLPRLDVYRPDRKFDRVRRY
jgi:glycine/D-amino acid oxidase-like deaminating enzyme